MPTNPADKWFDALHDDLKSLNEKVQRIELSLSEMKGQEIGSRMKSLENKVDLLEDFKSKAIGALIILNGIWGIVAAYVVWKLTRS